MTNHKIKTLPQWVFSILAVGAFIACGIYLGVMRVEGVSIGHGIRAIGYGLLGLLMLWGMLGRR